MGDHGSRRWLLDGNEDTEEMVKRSGVNGVFDILLVCRGAS